MVVKKVWTSVKDVPDNERFRTILQSVSCTLLNQVESKSFPILRYQLTFSLQPSLSPWHNPNDISRRQERDNQAEGDDVTAQDVARVDSLEPSLQDLVQSAALINIATFKQPEEGKHWEANGDPTEIALQVFAHKAGHGKPHLYVNHRLQPGNHSTFAFPQYPCPPTPTKYWGTSPPGRVPCFREPLWSRPGEDPNSRTRSPARHHRRSFRDSCRASFRFDYQENVNRLAICFAREG
jgi:Cation transport ATPase (P-type)